MARTRSCPAGMRPPFNTNPGGPFTDRAISPSTPSLRMARTVMGEAKPSPEEIPDGEMRRAKPGCGGPMRRR